MKDAISDPPPARGAAESWIRDYRRDHDTGGFDEVFDAGRSPRSAYRSALDQFGRLGELEVRKRWEEARALLREHGVGYDAYGDPSGHGTARPWTLSPLPVVIGAGEWQALSRGLLQRARLIDRLLGDLFGEQDLLKRRLLPPEIVFGNPRFSRSCADAVRPGDQRLFLYAADLGRREDGSFLLLADRTEAPSGAGYALENRLVLGGVLPEVYRACGVERLDGFFGSVREMLRKLAPHHRENPRIALLTSGPYTQTYFEQAFLSQQLGLTLVQAEDLTVRDAHVYLKALGGLQPVDVILRRLPDDACDPLEIRTDRSLGVAGLLEAARAGNVGLANPVGSAIGQSPALLPYLPAICRALLDEDLILPSIPTHWCGEPKSLSFVEEHLPELIIRPAFAKGQHPPVVARDLSAHGLEELRNRIRNQPKSYVAQEQIVLSTVPALDQGDVDAGHLWMRAYLVASGSGYEVMPGALSRVGRHGEHLGLSLRGGGRSADTWVLGAAHPEDIEVSVSVEAPALLSRGGGDLQSRVADDLFWLGRYAERADGTARIARAITARLSDLGARSEGGWPCDLDALFAVLAGQTHAGHPVSEGSGAEEQGRHPGSSGSSGKPPWLLSAEQALLAAVFENEPVESLKVTIASAYRIAKMLRDRISIDTWRTLAQLDRDLHESRSVTGPSRLRALLSLLNGVVTTLAAFSGLTMDSMTRGHGWRFLDMGRRVERAGHLAALLRGTIPVAWPRERAVLEAVLEVADSSMSYRRRYLASLQAAPVTDLLLMDDTNPRSVTFQIAALLAHIDAIPRDPGVFRSPEQKLAICASSHLALADVVDLCATDENGQRPLLAEALDKTSATLRELSTSLSSVYLNHAVVSRQMQGGQ